MYKIVGTYNGRLQQPHAKATSPAKTDINLIKQLFQNHKYAILLLMRNAHASGLNYIIIE